MSIIQEVPKAMKHKGNQGFTLIELLVAMVIASIVMAAVVSAYQLQVRGKNTQEVLTDMNQTARAALEIMIHEIQTAGCDPLRTADAGVLIADAGEFSFVMDIGDGASFQPDGAADDPNERVRYALYTDGTGSQNLGRATGTAADGSGGTLQPLARNVDALDFVYLDEDGNITAAVDEIRSIQLTVVARSGRESGLLHSFTDATAYQNQQGDEILAAQNDSFRRLLLTTTINCYNLNN